MDFTYFKQASRGDEKFRVIFWIYFLIGSIGIGLLAAIFNATSSTPGTPFTGFTLALIIVLPYAAWVLGALWMCAFNTEWKAWGYLARGIIIYTVVSYIYQIAT